MKRSVLGVVIGFVVGGIIFYPLTIPISLTFMLNMELGSNAEVFGMADFLSWLIPLFGAIIGGLVGGLIRKKKLSDLAFKHPTVTIVFWSSVIIGVLGLEIGALFSGITLIGLGNTSTAIDVWLFSGLAMIVGLLVGAVIGLLIASIRFAMKKFYVFHRQAP